MDLVTVEEIAGIVESSLLCQGNSDVAFIDIAEKRGGSLVDKDGSVVAYVDTTLKTLCQNGSVTRNTVRRNGCALLWAMRRAHPLRCAQCSQYRHQLRMMKWRYENSTKCNTAERSHTNYHYLCHSEMILHVKNIQVQKKNLSLSIKALPRKIIDLMEAEGAVLTEAKSNDLEKIVETHLPIEADQQSSNFQNVLWEHKSNIIPLPKRNKRCGILS